MVDLVVQIWPLILGFWYGCLDITTSWLNFQVGKFPTLTASTVRLVLLG